MNDNTIISVHCYAGDAHQVVQALPLYLHHECPVVCLSPADSQVKIAGVDCKWSGKAAYIGQDSFDRQLRHLEILAAYRADFFLLNDSDSFCVSPEIPRLCYKSDVVWANIVTEPRPHESPYPKIAMQPPYFVSRRCLEKLVEAIRRIPAHPITPYIDYLMVAATHEAGLTYRAFTDTEHASRTGDPAPSDPWQQLAYRIQYMGAVFHHPIKTPEQVNLCVEARKRYEQP